ncbi:alpha/beta fold hydrolase [Thioalkalivibrio sp. ALJT]|uniref:alpha/beta fold hydrolase n=1 Tax=Thioalkalivibrio sp. ALJT TaxID=1158146 RepID=UPI0003660C39|nr:alpha/beta fold hydrolase [Thioalkalivibrio sp. ALJT]
MPWSRILGLTLAATLLSPACAVTPDPEALRASIESEESAALAAPVRVWPAPEPQGVVIALHSFRDHSGAYAEVGPWLAARGYSVHALDQQGHGRRESHGRWSGIEPMLADVVAMVEQVQARYPQQPVFLLGESMGGSAALATVATHPELEIAGVIAVAPGLRGGISGRRLWDAAVRTGERIAGGLAVTIDPDYSDRLTPAAAARFRDDPAILRRVRMDTYAGVVWLAQYATDHIERVTVPVVYLWGEQDGTILQESVCVAARAHPYGHAEVWIEPEWPHLLLHAPDWPQTARRLLDWMQRVQAEPPGGLPLPSTAQRNPEACVR